MSLDELLLMARALTDPDKVRLIRALTHELATADPASLAGAGEKFALWSPYECYEGAAILQKFGEEQRGEL